MMEPHFKDLLSRLDERSLHMANRSDDILEQLKKLNSKVAHHETEIHRIKLEIASASGVWTGVNKTIIIIISILSIAVGAIVTYNWH
jgi:chromosome segregation ATPase